MQNDLSSHHKASHALPTSDVTARCCLLCSASNTQCCTFGTTLPALLYASNAQCCTFGTTLPALLYASNAQCCTFRTTLCALLYASNAQCCPLCSLQAPSMRSFPHGSFFFFLIKLALPCAGTYLQYIHKSDLYCPVVLLRTKRQLHCKLSLHEGAPICHDRSGKFQAVTFGQPRRILETLSGSLRTRPEVHIHNACCYMLSSMLSQHHAQAHDNMLTALLIASLHHDFQNHLKWHIRLLRLPLQPTLRTLAATPARIQAPAYCLTHAVHIWNTSTLLATVVPKFTDTFVSLPMHIQTSNV